MATSTRTAVAALAVAVAVGGAPSVAAKPAFDCTDPAVRRNYPAQCPELGVPFLLGGGSPGGGGPGRCGGLCGVVRDVIDKIPGLGGIL